MDERDRGLRSTDVSQTKDKGEERSGGCIELKGCGVWESDAYDNQSKLLASADVLIRFSGRADGTKRLRGEAEIRGEKRRIVGVIEKAKVYVNVDPSGTGSRNANNAVMMMTMIKTEDNESGPGSWRCAACTFMNTSSTSQCEMCFSAKPTRVGHAADQSDRAHEEKVDLIFGYLTRSDTYGKRDSLDNVYDIASRGGLREKDHIVFRLSPNAIQIPHPDDVHEGEGDEFSHEPRRRG